jgi:hypothetical protein
MFFRSTPSSEQCKLNATASLRPQCIWGCTQAVGEILHQAFLLSSALGSSDLLPSTIQLIRGVCISSRSKKYYTWPGSNWRPSACEADVRATRPQVLGVLVRDAMLSRNKTAIVASARAKYQTKQPLATLVVIYYSCEETKVGGQYRYKHYQKENWPAQGNENRSNDGSQGTWED